MNLPNCLTVFRIILAVVFMPVIFGPGVNYKFAAFAIFLLASFTDYWDGRIAREKNLVTDFGILMDPLADKILVLAAFISFAQMGIIPAWMVLAVMARDLLITALRLTMPPGRSQSARSSGKNKTVLQFMTIVGILLYLVFRETAYWDGSWDIIARRTIYFSMLIVVAMTLWSGIRYAMAQTSKEKIK